MSLPKTISPLPLNDPTAQCISQIGAMQPHLEGLPQGALLLPLLAQHGTLPPRKARVSGGVFGAQGRSCAQ